MAGGQQWMTSGESQNEESLDRTEGGLQMQRRVRLSAERT